MSKIIGRKYSNSTVVNSDCKSVTPSGKRKYKFTLQCTCGHTYTLADKALGRAKEPCEKCRKAALPPPHGLYDHPLYRTWVGMHSRCGNSENVEYDNYGKRGITVCRAWTGNSSVPGAKKSITGFRNFIADMGDRPEGQTLDRVDNNGNYEPSNCRWATPTEQGGNRRDNVHVTLDGETRLFSHWLDIAGLNSSTIYEKMRGTNMTHEYALNRYWIKVGGERKRFHKWAEHFGLDPVKLWNFVDGTGLPVWEALEIVHSKISQQKSNMV